MIISFKDKITEDLFYGKKVKIIQGRLAVKARIRLDHIHEAISLKSFGFPPSLKCRLLGNHRFAIWVATEIEQWEIQFDWDNDKQEASQVQLNLKN